MPTRIEGPTVVAAAGRPPKRIEEFVGRLNTATENVSVARMVSPTGWEEPAQTPDFDEYTLVLRGMLRAASGGTAIDVRAGEAIVARAGETVRYSTPEPGGAEYIAVCVPAFSPAAAHREEAGPPTPGAAPPGPRRETSTLAAPRSELRPVGVVRCAVTSPLDEGWGDVVAEIELAPEYRDATRGLEAFSHALVLTHLHRAAFDPSADLVRRPRGRADMPEVGVFAQRARHRPNPIGVTAVEIVAVAPGAVTVRGLDAVDGTPVLDVKPYVPRFDGVRAARVPEWMERLLEGYFRT
jgi:tRNA-Thr(GGU) m(6)t(6)A37 methyltransferase TsaA